MRLKEKVHVKLVYGGVSKQASTSAMIPPSAPEFPDAPVPPVPPVAPVFPRNKIPGRFNSPSASWLFPVCSILSSLSASSLSMQAAAVPVAVALAMRTLPPSMTSYAVSVYTARQAIHCPGASRGMELSTKSGPQVVLIREMDRRDLTDVKYV
jgi:hypothetical protein